MDTSTFLAVGRRDGGTGLQYAITRAGTLHDGPLTEATAPMLRAGAPVVAVRDYDLLNYPLVLQIAAQSGSVVLTSPDVAESATAREIVGALEQGTATIARLHDPEPARSSLRERAQTRPICAHSRFASIPSWATAHPSVPTYCCDKDY